MPQSDSAENRLRDALRHQAAGKPDLARALLADLPPLTSLTDRAAFVRLHRNLDEPKTEDEAKLEKDLGAPTDGWQAAYDRARALFLLDRYEALEAALAAEAEAGADRGPALLLLKIHLEAGNPNAAADAILTASARRDQPGGLLLAAAKVLGQAGHKSQAERLLEAAEPHQSQTRAEFDYVAAGIRGTTPTGADQGEMAAAIFDKFASDYDEVLGAIGNNGPDLIGKLLDALPLARMKKLQVLDAGCGTGLCAKLLRPFAKNLQGADISVPMLEKAKKRKLYHGLTRTDLNQPATIPRGPFDLIVLADVLIYFGDLAPVLAPLSQRLSPGGWLLLTVENGGNLASPGYQLGASGRHKHSEAHIAQALSVAGLGRPKHEINETLRHEFGTPIPGLAVAAQKPMLAF